MGALGPALGVLELESLARGVVVADALVKKAAVRIVRAEALTPGKYLLLFTGPVAEVDESFREGVRAAGAALLDQLHLSQVADGLARALIGDLPPGPADATVGIVETNSVASCVLACDTALKHAEVRLTHLQLAKGIGGKGWFMVAGAQHDVEAALERAAASVGDGLLVATELIQRPHADLRGPVL
ncbi:MAG: BMC domain-containing protein [Archangium sp.]|nr:BMC domain-containing protein [Archangium sp.]